MRKTDGRGNGSTVRIALLDYRKAFDLRDHHLLIANRGGSRKFRKRGPSPPPRMKTSLSGHAAYSIVGVYVMQSKVKLTFQKHFENTRKMGGGGPPTSAPPLNPPMAKSFSLGVKPTTYTVIWIIDFLRDRQQRVKINNNCYSSWLNVPAPQGTRLGPWLFLVMINDFNPGRVVLHRSFSIRSGNMVRLRRRSPANREF